MAILRKRKNKLNKAARKEKKPRVVTAKKEIPSAQEVLIEKAKYYTPQTQKVQPQTRISDLPGGYGIDKIVLQVRDPWWCHAYWEVTGETQERLKSELRDEFLRAKRILRVYDVSHIIFNGRNAHRFFDIHINDYTNSWYIDTGGPGRSWCVDLGLLLADGKFITVMRSNTVHTPLEGPSWVTDEEWMIPDDMFARLYGLGVGFGSSPTRVKKLWQERLKRELGSGAISSVSSPIAKKAVRGFWLAVNTELIVYGATEPNAKVTVEGKGINLRPDGTFSLRFALPEGKQAIPVKAASFDKKEERTITPIVSKETK
ncbi:MAG: DUF4912 domain-containing protein [Candidatus Omnitrophota bacterium]